MSTTIRVSEETLRLLERVKEKLGARSMDEALRSLLRERRSLILRRAFGMDRGRISPFSEEIEVKIVLDTYAWIEIFIGSDRGRRVLEILEEADESYTPSVVLAEIARKYAREGFDRNFVRERLQLVLDATDIIEVNEEIALESGFAYLELLEKAKARGLSKPSLFDAIVLACARNIGGRLVTGDEHLRGFEEIIWIGD